MLWKQAFKEVVFRSGLVQRRVGKPIRFFCVLRGYYGLIDPLVSF